MDERIRIALESQNPWWFGKPFDRGIERLDRFPGIVEYLHTREILLLVGARRTGKSTLLYQVIHSLLEKGIQDKAILFINLDEPLFRSMSDDPQLLSGIVEEHLARNRDLDQVYLFIDEVQNYSHWVGAIKTLYDTRSMVKCILTGSTSTLLEQEISTRLSGRYFSVTVYPLSFSEYLHFNGVSHPTQREKRVLFADYLKYGGFPRVVLEQKEDLKVQLLKNYYETIYLKDIIFPNRLRNNRDIVDLLYFLLSNSGTLLSYNRIARDFHIATDTVREYIGYAEHAFLLYTLMKFDYSVKKQLANPKKVYCLDTGLVNAVAFTFSENCGRLLENLVCSTLVKRYEEVYYHKGRYECDFVIRSHRAVIQVIQVTQSLHNEKTRAREIRGLCEAMNAYGLEEGTIITEDESEELVVDGNIIHVVPITTWLDPP